MEYRKLGNAGIKVSAISLGSWLTFGQTVDDETTEACMRTAWEGGVNFFDGAEAYGNGKAEEAMGRVFRKVGWPRDRLVISTKVIRVGEAANQSGLSRKHLVEAVDAALERMGLGYVDLCFCHRPDPDTPLEEIVHTMNELIGRGKILYWGTSEFSPTDLVRLFEIAERRGLVGPSMEQTNHSMLNRRRVDGELRPLFEQYRLGTTIYSPLALGILTGKYNEGIPEGSRIDVHDAPWMHDQLTGENLERVRKLGGLAEELGMSQAQLALAWCLKNPNVSTAIIGATKPGHVEENLKAAEMVAKLDAGVMERIEKILRLEA